MIIIVKKYYKNLYIIKSSKDVTRHEILNNLTNKILLKAIKKLSTFILI